MKAVQTLSRLNRAPPEKHDVFVLDYVNDAETIETAFADYYRTTILSKETDPNKLHDLKAALDGSRSMHPGRWTRWSRCTCPAPTATGWTQKDAIAGRRRRDRPVPTPGGGRKAEPELDRLSNILKNFNDQFGSIPWTDADRVHRLITQEIPAKVAFDNACQNARKNSDKQNGPRPVVPPTAPPCFCRCPRARRP